MVHEAQGSGEFRFRQVRAGEVLELFQAEWFRVFRCVGGLHHHRGHDFTPSRVGNPDDPRF